MNIEPFYICQSGVQRTDDARWEWVKLRYREAQSAGAKWCRVTYHPINPNLTIVEGWWERPADEGKPRWNLYLASLDMLYIGPKGPTEVA